MYSSLWTSSASVTSHTYKHHIFLLHLMCKIEKSARKAQPTPGACTATAMMIARPHACRLLAHHPPTDVNERKNQPTNKQTRRMAIPPGRGLGNNKIWMRASAASWEPVLDHKRIIKYHTLKYVRVVKNIKYAYDTRIIRGPTQVGRKDKVHTEGLHN